MNENSKEKIREFVLKVCRKQELGDEEDIFESGIINSLFAMQLVLFLEKQFNIHVDGNDLKKDNFKNINVLVSYVEKKKASGVI
jgi:methoxymalonate biosynthesis acyl carrier protein